MSSTEALTDDDAGTHRLEGAVSLFGHEPSRASLELRPRSKAWRLRKAALPGLGFLLLAPVVALLPPHVPWAVAALAVGFFLARRRWKERFTVLGFDGRCPRCGAELSLPTGTRLKTPHSLHCDRCRHEPVLTVEADRLDRARPRS